MNQYLVSPLIIGLGILGTLLIRKLQLAHIKIDATFKATPDSIIVSNAEGKILHTNQQAERILGYSADEFKQMTIEDLIPHELREIHVKHRKNFLVNQIKPEIGKGMFYGAMSINRKTAEFSALSKTGELIPVSINLSAYHQGSNIMIISSLFDLRRQKKLERGIATDPLTGLLNRTNLELRMMEETRLAFENNNEISLIMSDIDYFKNLNDDLGHIFGDRILKEIAHLLRNNVRSTDIVYRYGGEEFLIICPNTNREGARILAENLRSKVESLKTDSGRKITMSFGVTTFCADRVSDRLVMDFLKTADNALYEAKSKGRNMVVCQ